MSQVIPDRNIRFANGAGRHAQVDGQDVFLGMQIVVYGLDYWVVDARPSGIGFTLYAVNSEGRQFDFKTKEVTLAEKPAEAPVVVVQDAPDLRSVSSLEREKINGSIVTNIENVFPNITISTGYLDDAQLRELHAALQLLQRNPMPERLPWGSAEHAIMAAASHIAMLHAANWYQAMRIVTELAPLINDTNVPRSAAEFLQYWEDFARLNHSKYYDLKTPPKWLKKLTTDAAGAKADVRVPAKLVKPIEGHAGLAEALEVIARVPVASTKSSAKASGDEVTEYLKIAKTPEDLRILLNAARFPDSAEVVQKYSHLSFGLQKMSVTNLLRKAVKSGSVTL